jgi:2-iminobutanoate/2-iminopropanoate deaminase
MVIAMNDSDFSPLPLETPKGHYSHAIAAGSLLFISGQLPFSAQSPNSTGLAFDKQCYQVFNNIDQILKENELTRENLASVRVYINDLKRWPEFNALYAVWLGDHTPARAVVPVPELHYGAMLEIEAIASFAPQRT